jgi:rod shape-determining protein MreC
METILGRFRNLIVLAAILFAQLIGLAVQVKRPAQQGDTRLIRVWTVSAITPLEKAVVNTQQFLRHAWFNYVYLRGVRRENRTLRAQLEQMKIEQVRLKEDADMARRIQTLLAFKEQYIDSTVAAQVIGTSGSDQSRVLYIDKGSQDGIRPDMAVITPNGIVGKIVQVFPGSAQVLPINDQLSGVGVALKNTRLQGILRGAPNGTTTVQYVMADERVVPGEEIITSGGDRIFPKGLPVGKVVDVSPGKDLFLNIRVLPSARLDRLEEVLVVTKVSEKAPDTQDLGPIRASDILAQRLPTVPNQPQAAANGNAAQPAAGAAGTATKPAAPGTVAGAAGTSTAAASATHAPGGTTKPPTLSGVTAPSTGVASGTVPKKPAGSTAAAVKPASPDATPDTGTATEPSASGESAEAKPKPARKSTDENEPNATPSTTPKPAQPTPPPDNPQR